MSMKNAALNTKYISKERVLEMNGPMGDGMVKS